MDRIPWNEADTKVKSLNYLFIGAERQRFYHQSFPHSNINTISAFELFHELSLLFTRYRDTTYDRFLLFTCNRKDDEKVEIIHCRTKALGAHFRLGTAEDDFIKNLFTAFKNNSEIQSEVLTETKTQLNKERGKQNQRAIACRIQESIQMDNQISLINPTQPHLAERRFQHSPEAQPRRNQQRNPTLSTPCRLCGAPFSLKNLLFYHY